MTEEQILELERLKKAVDDSKKDFIEFALGVGLTEDEIDESIGGGIKNPKGNP